MSGGWLFWFLLLAVLGLWTLGAHNRVTSLKAALVAAWVQVQAALQARGQALDELLPRLTEPLASEAAALEAVQQAQAQVLVASAALAKAPLAADAAAELSKADGVLVAVLVRVQALVEQRPALLADAEVAAALRCLKDLPPRLLFARQLFIDAGAAYNLAAAQFPTRVLGSLLRFGRAGRL